MTQSLTILADSKGQTEAIDALELRTATPPTCADCRERARLNIGRPLGHDCDDHLASAELERAWSKAGRNLTRTCDECSRRFDMLDAIDADEWNYGHDCEV